MHSVGLIDESLAFSKAGGEFSPLEFSPAKWLRSDTGVFVERTGASATTPSVAGGDPVGSWLDQSGNARHSTAPTDTKRFTLRLAVQNGMNSVEADGVDDVLEGALFTLNQPAHFMFAARVITNVANGRLMDGGTFNTAAIIGEADGDIATFGGSFGPVLTAAAGAWGIYSFLWSGASSFARLNAGSAVTGDVGAGNPGGVTLGDSAEGGGLPCNIEFGEFLAFPSALSVGDETLVRNYLNSRFATF